MLDILKSSYVTFLKTVMWPIFSIFGSDLLKFHNDLSWYGFVFTLCFGMNVTSLLGINFINLFL